MWKIDCCGHLTNVNQAFYRQGNFTPFYLYFSDLITRKNLETFQEETPQIAPKTGSLQFCQNKVRQIAKSQKCRFSEFPGGLLQD